MIMPPPSLARDHQKTLLKVAADSIEHGLRHYDALTLDPKDYPPELQIPRAVFVTLTITEELRGCVGTLESGLPLVANVAKYAYAAAFNDPRFPRLTPAEFPTLDIHVSILSDLEAVSFQSEAELLQQIRPGIDGLLLEEGSCRGTLLPSVWKNVPKPREFLRVLKRKAGLPADYWSSRMQVHRYTTCCIP